MIFDVVVAAGLDYLGESGPADLERRQDLLARFHVADKRKDCRQVLARRENAEFLAFGTKVESFVDCFPKLEFYLHAVAH